MWAEGTGERFERFFVYLLTFFSFLLFFSNECFIRRGDLELELDRLGRSHALQTLSDKSQIQFWNVGLC